MSACSRSAWAESFFCCINLLLWNALLGMSADLRKDWARANRGPQGAEGLSQRIQNLEAPRDWLKKTSAGPDESSGSFIASRLQLQQVAGKYKVQIENPQIGSVEKAPNHQSVSVTIETKSAWEPLVHFLYDVQQPEGFHRF